MKPTLTLCIALLLHSAVIGQDNREHDFLNALIKVDEKYHLENGAKIALKLNYKSKIFNRRGKTLKQLTESYRRYAKRFAFKVLDSSSVHAMNFDSLIDKNVFYKWKRRWIDYPSKISKQSRKHYFLYYSRPFFITAEYVMIYEYSYDGTDDWTGAGISIHLWKYDNDQKTAVEIESRTIMRSDPPFR